MSIVADGRREATRPTGAKRVAVTGSTGFIGRHVVAALRARGIESMALDHAAFDDQGRRRRTFEGVDAVVHCVSAVSGSSAAIRAANVDATRALVRSSRAAGVDRVIAVSTAAVTGIGPHRGASGTAAPHASSPVSRARAEGEQILAEAGAVIVRPNIVWGAGDRWVVPTIARIAAGSNDKTSTWQAVVSAVGVRDLAEGLVGISTSAHPTPVGPLVLHADAPTPIPISAIVEWVREHVLTSAEPRGPLPLLSDHQRSMLEVDNWFDGSAFWRAAGVPAPEPFQPLPTDAEWYRDHILTT